MHKPTDVIRKRFSCRRYLNSPVGEAERRSLAGFLTEIGAGPFGTPARFGLVAATAGDRQALKGLGTYGFIRHAPGFIVGAVQKGPRSMEDFGYLMEKAVLFATGLNLGTCWLGGSFTKSNFARTIAASGDEVVPAVTAVGYIAADGKVADIGRRQEERRLPREQLFFDRCFAEPLPLSDAGNYAEALEMVRLAPSASNKQPWRIVKNGDGWHFYLQRTPGYGKGSLVFTLLRLADLQLLDIGIAMCHFELTARELGLAGRWASLAPDLVGPDDNVSYVASWVSDN